MLSHLVTRVEKKARGLMRAWALLASLVLALALDTGAAEARRFGPPWQGEVVVESTVVYLEPDRASAPVGPLPQGALLVVVAEQDGWVKIEHGWIPDEDVREKNDPWIAEVRVPSASVYAKPHTEQGIRRTAPEGTLLRVTGIAGGVEGDPHIWWSTTEGYVALDTIQAATSEWAEQWQLPAAEEALQGWWGEVVQAANVRVGPTTDAPAVGQFAGGERVKVLQEDEAGELVGGSSRWYKIDGGRYAGAWMHSSLVRRIADPTPNTTAQPEANGDTWITVDRATNTLTLMRGGEVQLVTYVALGVAGRESPQGEHATFGKYRADRMTSASLPDAERSYNLPNVPYVQYYLEGGYAIHGTYWHDRYGSAESQGCINLTWTDSAYLFGITSPAVFEDELARWTTPEQATAVYIVN